MCDSWHYESRFIVRNEFKCEDEEGQKEDGIGWCDDDAFVKLSRDLPINTTMSARVCFATSRSEK
jgi:hypothetical protein